MSNPGGLPVTNQGLCLSLRCWSQWVGTRAPIRSVWTRRGSKWTQSKTLLLRRLSLCCPFKTGHTVMVIQHFWLCWGSWRVLGGGGLGWGGCYGDIKGDLLVKWECQHVVTNRKWTAKVWWSKPSFSRFFFCSAFLSWLNAETDVNGLWLDPRICLWMTWQLSLKLFSVICSGLMIIVIYSLSCCVYQWACEILTLFMKCSAVFRLTLDPIFYLCCVMVCSSPVYSKPWG